MNDLPESMMFRTKAVTAASGLPVAEFSHDHSNERQPYQELSSDKSFYRDKKVLLLSRNVKESVCQTTEAFEQPRAKGR